MLVSRCTLHSIVRNAHTSFCVQTRFMSYVSVLRSFENIFVFSLVGLRSGYWIREATWLKSSITCDFQWRLACKRTVDNTHIAENRASDVVVSQIERLLFLLCYILHRYRMITICFMYVTGCECCAWSWLRFWYIHCKRCPNFFYTNLW